MNLPKLNTQHDSGRREDAIAEAKMEVLFWKYLKGSRISPAYLHDLSVVIRLQMLEEKAGKPL